MRKIHDFKYHTAYVMNLAAFALDGEFGRYWLGQPGTSMAERGRWVRPIVVTIK